MTDYSVPMSPELDSVTIAAWESAIAGASALWTAKRRGGNRIAAYESSAAAAADAAVSGNRHVG